ncbi:MAG TPA: tripartite tricarboxylate transporter substrate binding protein [Burkholderiales bacterium]|nr:tripartite tricarboxylate transporter substrate binding protein [Burkholderiales bacterium]
MTALTAGIALAAGALAFAPAADAAAATDWPNKTVTVLAPFAAGGTVDIVARLVGQELTQDLGKSFIVDNRGGAGGTIATSILAHAAPDGYTLMVHHMGFAFNATLYTKVNYDTRRDIVPVALVGSTPNALVVNNSLPVKDVKEFLALARAKPGTINYGSGGPGSAGHLPMELLQSIDHIKLEHVPYKGSGPALVDLMGGQIQAMLLTMPAVMPYLQSGKLRAIATSGKKRSPALPNLPTLEEAGVKGFEYAPWYGFFAPAGTPPAVLDKLHDSVNKVLGDPAIAAKLGQQGIEVQPISREQFVETVDADIAKWGKIIKGLNLKGD